MTHTVLMGDPAHFSVVGGANPHTRDRYGRRKTVDKLLAIAQWERMCDLLRDHGLRVVVVPPDPELPGLVYPANAGIRIGEEFVLSHLTPTRAGEQAVYEKVVTELGLRCHALEHRFEGEADLFPAGQHYLFTHGEIRAQRFVARFGWPPWRRIYGFRSEAGALGEITAIAPLGKPILAIELTDERFYHGDTCLCSFGPNRSAVLAYLPVLSDGSRAELEHAFGDQLIALGDEDAAIYAANSFAFSQHGEHFLVMPEGVSDALVDRIRARGIVVLTTDVSEFYKKGGGSVKCMIGDLGNLL